MILHVSFVTIRGCYRTLIALQPLRHFRPGVEFEYLAYREGRLDNRLHRIQFCPIDVIRFFHRKRQVVVIDAQIHGISNRSFIYRRIDHWRLGRRILTSIIILRRIMENGITSLGYQFLAFRRITRINRHRVTNSTERDIPFTGVGGSGLP